MKVYLLPGLGFDDRIFARLDLEGLDAGYINWIEPEFNESISDYSKRLSAPVDPDHGPVVLVGYSFGGMIAQEIAALKRIDTIILLSSIKSRREMPFWFRIMEPLRVHRVFTKEMCIRTVGYWGPTHNFEAQADQELFKSMVGRCSNNYLQWALKALSVWQAPAVPPSTRLVHIHGARDKTFPVSLIEQPDAIVEAGSHIMVYKEPEIVSRLLMEAVKKTPPRGSRDIAS